VKGTKDIGASPGRKMYSPDSLLNFEGTLALQYVEEQRKWMLKITLDTRT
jgi:hypothetical protein